MAKHTTRRDPNWCAGSCQENDDQLAPKKTKGEESKNATELDTNDRNFWRDRAASNRNSIIAVNCYRSLTTKQVSGFTSGQTSTLMAEIQREAALLRRHADRLESLARNTQISRESHAYHLDQVKLHINAVGKHTVHLQAVREDVVPWQQRAIDKLTSDAIEVAKSTEAAINHLRENRNLLFVSEYRDHLTTIAGHSEDMKQTVDKFLDFEKAQCKLQQLEENQSY